MNKLKMTSTDLSQVNIDKIAGLFPNVITETRGETGKVTRAVDFDLLKQELSDVLVEGEKERYQLTWPGKKEAIINANEAIDKTLRPIKEDSAEWDNTQNLYIEGDNLDALKLLQESYLNKVKCIYIDPPYNTGKDFIYRDDFSETSQEYLEESGQVNEDGSRLFQNTESNGRFHSDWLTMIYSRLKLARNLLSEDGVIFISIDDNEIDNIRLILNELFGSSQFVAQIIWEKVYSPRMDVKGFSTSHDYILCYVKNSVDAIQREPFVQNSKQFNLYDETKNKYYRRRSIRKEGSNSLRSDAPNSFFPFTAPDGTEIFPIKPDGTEGCWRWSLSTYTTNVEQGNVEWIKQDSGWQVYAKQYIDEDATKPPETLWRHNEVNHNHGAAEELKQLLTGKFFDSPKPKELLMKILRLSTYKDKNNIILDFFSGSATSAHAVMQLNAEDSGNRKYIMVQLPETTDEKSDAYKAGFANICEIGKERIRRAAKKIKEETNADIDYGFRVYRVDSSNMKDIYYKPEKLGQATLDDLADNIKEDRSSEDLLIQVMLELGLELSLTMESRQLEGKTVHYVAGNSLIACFDESVSESLIKRIAEEQPLRVVFRDSSFRDDSARINVEELFKMLSPSTEIQVL